MSCVPCIGDHVVVTPGAAVYTELGRRCDLVSEAVQGIVVSVTSKVLGEPRFIRVILTDSVKYVSEKHVRVVS